SRDFGYTDHSSIASPRCVHFPGVGPATNGKVTIRYAGRLYHLGIGRAYGGQHILMVVTDNHITTSLKETGEIITEHYIDTSRNYQKPYWRKGQPPLT
ncbi:hypothetical protein QPX55_09665, partial [Corynebacterium accolens]|nr:hypothetical protein [Corynebacterium accolens]